MRSIRLVAVLCLSFALAGCGAGTGSIPTADEAKPAASQSESITPPSTTTTEPEVVEEPATDPSLANEGLPVRNIADKMKAKGDTDRKQILAEIHEYTGVKDDFWVWQLYVQGTTAVADVQGSRSGKRMLVALESDGDGWTATYQHKFIDSSEDALRAAAPAVTSELAERVDFVVPVEVHESYEKSAAALVKFGKSAGVSDMSVYAPTRLPEGFEWVKADFLDGALVVMYESGSDRLECTTIVGSDYGEVSPDGDYTNLRFDGADANMDRSFLFSEWAGKGPHLSCFDGGEHYVSASRGVSPAMVAAVAESMTRVK